LLKTYLEQQSYQDNLYQGNFYVDNSYINFRLTENEVVKLITRTMAEIKKMDQTKLKAYVTGAGSSTLANSWRPASDFNVDNVNS
jgi:hypothetical protein